MDESHTPSRRVASGTARSLRARALAFYLPQFHPIPENDEWWGRGFTEWTNVTRARPLFRNHHQPNLPADLGFYDLRVPEVREAQADLARAAGIEGFVYWHYWFAGRRLLERPLAEVAASGRPDFPFCIGWANASWSGHWYGSPRTTLVEQTYPGVSDYRRHFDVLVPFLTDDRYICVEGKPLIVIFLPWEVPDGQVLTDTWRGCAEQVGLPGLHIVGFDQGVGWDPRPEGYDGVIAVRFLQALFGRRARNAWLTGGDAFVADRHVIEKRAARLLRQPVRRRARHPWDIARRKLQARAWRTPMIVPYAQAIQTLIPAGEFPFEVYPCVVPNWDNTPRAGLHGSVLTGSTPDLFAEHVERGVQVAERIAHPDHRLLFIKSWNEWAEGNYLEPDLQWGREYLDAFRNVISRTP